MDGYSSQQAGWERNVEVYCGTRAFVRRSIAQLTKSRRYIQSGRRHCFPREEVECVCID